METTLRNKKVTRTAILNAIKECDALGKEAFLAKHGYGDSTKYVLRHGGRTYPSKAIVGVAAGLAAKEFSGGKDHLSQTLSNLGFKLGVLAFAFVAAKVLTAAHKDFNKQLGDESVDARYYASGSTRPSHVLGFGHIGQAFMVTATEMSPACEDALYHVAANSDVDVAVDSGAFGRCIVNFPVKGKLPHPELSVGMHCPNPFSAAEWQTTFDLYNRLGAILGSRLMVVAPDQVGFQSETLELVREYRSEINALLDNGVRVIVVAQKGAINQIAFDREVEAILGRSDYVRGLPCNKAATSLAEIEAFAAARQPAELHLLGLGLRNKIAPKAALTIAKASPKTRLSLDSCLLLESVGKSNGRASHPYEKAGGPRVFTAAKEKAKELIDAGLASLDLHDLAIRLAWGEA